MKTALEQKNIHSTNRNYDCNQLVVWRTRNPKISKVIHPAGRSWMKRKIDTDKKNGTTIKTKRVEKFHDHEHAVLISKPVLRTT